MEEGSQLFSWSYSKDYSVSNGLDCAILDYIILPARNVETSVSELNQQSDVQLSINPNPFVEKLNLVIKVKESTSFHVSVVDHLGRVFYETDANNVEAGTYKYSDVKVPESAGSFYVIIKSNKTFFVKPVIRLKQ